jgi:transcriptional regulator with XRE-family HTH domain
MREKRGLTQRKLAHDLGISQNYVPAIESGHEGQGRRCKISWSGISGATLMSCSR